jgi:RNA recognition motif-containing protein
MIGNKLFVGNLYVRVNKKQLEELFSYYGNVKKVELIEGSGFGYVEMSDAEEAERAKRALDGAEFQERVLRVK